MTNVLIAKQEEEADGSNEEKDDEQFEEDVEESEFVRDEKTITLQALAKLKKGLEVKIV